MSQDRKGTPTLSADTTLTDLKVIRGSGAARTGSLLVISGAAADLGTHMVVEEQVVIGRDTSGLQLRDGRSSRRHAAVIRQNDSRYTVEDLKSTNGTLLNGREIELPTVLGDGDKIYIGNTVLKFTLVDETEAEYLQHMSRMAGTDPLTGLHAKHRFDSMLQEAMRGAHLASRPLVAMMMDMDGLKAINDRHGHRMGAHSIASVGRHLGLLLRGRGEACRFGGDEFCAYLPDSDIGRGLTVAEEIRSTVETLDIELDGVFPRPTISIGVALAPGTDFDRAVALADEALYRAKAAGRNAVSD